MSTTSGDDGRSAPAPEDGAGAGEAAAPERAAGAGEAMAPEDGAAAGEAEGWAGSLPLGFAALLGEAEGAGSSPGQLIAQSLPHTS